MPQQQPLVAVRGETVLEVDPEIARIEVSVAARDADRAKTAQALGERAAAVDKVLASFPDVIDRIETSGARVSPQLATRNPGERMPGYYGVVRHALTVTGFDRLGELLAQLADLEHTEIGGPWWELRPGSPAYAQARVAAARDAVRRARDYAVALGAELVGLVELADARLMSETRGQAELAGGFSARLPQRVRAAAPDEFTTDLSPGKQTVRATVEARFTITRPDLGLVERGL
jgi:uncharacterized protein YggE